MFNSTASPARNHATAFFLLRATLGLNILMHGLSRILAGPSVFTNSLLHMFQKTFLPVWSVHAFGLALPWIELTLGLLLLVGLGTRMALIGGSLLMLVLTFGTSLRQDWQSAGVQLIYAAVYAALLAHSDKNAFSLDELLTRK